MCDFIGCGRTEKINYVVMSLLGPNLSELRKRQPQQKLSVSTVLRLGIQIINAVQAVHNCGYLHRDIKPSNFAIGGYYETSRCCYILDFGLARQYITPTGELRQPRSIAGFRGTVRYASVNAHLGHDLGRHDDLWSVFYMISELANGQLPWRKIRNREEVGEYKLAYDHGKLITSLPIELKKFHAHLRTLTYFSKPDYPFIIKLFEQAIERLGIQETDPFDWEQPDNGFPSSASVISPAVNSQAQPEEKKDGLPSSKTHCSDADIVPDNMNCNSVKKIIITVDNKLAASTGNADTPDHKMVHPIEQEQPIPAFNDEDPKSQKSSKVNHNIHQLCIDEKESDSNDDSHPNSKQGDEQQHSSQEAPDSDKPDQQQDVKAKKLDQHQKEDQEVFSSDTADSPPAAIDCAHSFVKVESTAHIPHPPLNPPPSGYFCTLARRRRFKNLHSTKH